MKDYPIDINNKTVFWGRIRKNYYWGVRGGTRHKDGSLCFKIKKWRNGSNNTGPVGYKLKRVKRGKI